MSIHYEEYDEIDRKIAITLSKDASLTNADIGKIVGLSSSATNERIRKLKRDGKIKNIIALIKSDLLNMNLGVFIFVLVDDRNYNKQFLENVSKHDNILECHHITGKYSYLLKVRVADTKDLENFITDFLKSQLGVIETMTQVILSSSKENSFIVE